jgi:hypothetical protein
MIDLAILKSVVDLFNKSLNIIDGRAKIKREHFERMFKPLYERMETIAKEYHAAVSRTASQLGVPDPDYSAILDELKSSRSRIVIARNGIIGEASAFKDKFQTGEPTAVLNEDKLAKLAFHFAESVYDYFDKSEEAFAREETVMTGLLISLAVLSEPRRDERKYDPDDDPNYEGDPYAYVTLGRARREAQYAVGILENRWTDVSKAYADLKLFCEPL